MNLNLIKYLSLSAFCAAVAGCVNYDTNSQQKVRFYSEDTPEVTVSVNGEVIGETTCSMVLERAVTYSVIFSKEGYQSATYDLVPYEDPDTGVVSFIDEVYCPTLVPVVAGTEEPVKAEPAKVEPAGTEEPVKAEPAEVEPAETEEPVKAEPAEVEPAETEEPVKAETAEVEPAGTEEPVKAEPAEVEPAETEEPVKAEPAGTEEPVVAETPAEAEETETITLTDLRAELAEIKRQRKLNLISQEEFERRIKELSDEVSRTY